MPTPAEIRESIPSRMAALGISQMELCKLSGWTHPQLSGFLRGKRSGMAFEEMSRLNSTVVELERLAKLLAPVPIDFSRTDCVRELIQRYKNGEISFYSSDEDANSARVQIIVTAISAAEREILRASAIGALIEGRV